MFDNKICHLTFSHTDCVDVWKIYFPQMKKHFSVGIPHFLGLNEYHKDIPNYVEPIFYQEDTPYSSRLLYLLNSLDSYEYIFLDHEDMFLYSDPDYEKLKEYYQILCSGFFDYIRLIKNQNVLSFPVNTCPTLYSIDLKSKWIFSVQPSFWRRVVLIDILKKNLKSNIWELEVKSQRVVKKMALKAAYSHRAGTLRGLHHFDNEVYPYIATAIGKGKWNLSEYGKELENLLKKYGVDPRQRGWL